MRLDTPRIEPLDAAEIDPELRERFGDGPILNIFRTLARHPKLVKRWLVFGNHVLAKSTLTARDRELAILRVGWLCRAGYEWGQHVLIARASGVDDDEIERIADGPDAPGWSERERALLRATDELHGDAFVADETWAELTAHFEGADAIRNAGARRRGGRGDPADRRPKRLDTLAVLGVAYEVRGELGGAGVDPAPQLLVRHAPGHVRSLWLRRAHAPATSSSSAVGAVRRRRAWCRSGR